MAEIIKLDIVSDVACPWCIIGYKRLEEAISEMKVQDRVDIEWQPFELNPGMPAEGEGLHAHMTRKYGTTADDNSRTFAQMTALGTELGFTFVFFDDFKMVNTQDVHILLEYARESGKQTELKMRLFEAFFSERKDVSDRQILIHEIESVGLNAHAARAILDDDAVRKHVQTQEAYWQSLGVSAVPTIVFNRSSAITGAQSVDVYKQALAELLEQ